MLMVDGYIVNDNNRNWLYGIDEMSEEIDHEYEIMNNEGE